MIGLELFAHITYVCLLIGTLSTLFFFTFKRSDIPRYFFLVFGLLILSGSYLSLSRITEVATPFVNSDSLLSLIAFESLVIHSIGFASVALAYFFADIKRWSFIAAEITLPFFIGLSVFSVFEAPNATARLVWIVASVTLLIVHAIYSTFFSRVFKRLMNTITIPYVLIVTVILFVGLFSDSTEIDSFTFEALLLSLNFATYLLFIFYTLFIVKKKENDVLLFENISRIESLLLDSTKKSSKFSLADFEDLEEMEEELFQLAVEQMLENGLVEPHDEEEGIYIRIS